MRRYFTTEVNPDYLSNELKAMKSLHQMPKAAYLSQPVLGRLIETGATGSSIRHLVFPGNITRPTDID